MSYHIGSRGAWRCQFAWAWRIHKSEKHSNYRTWKIWDRDMVLLPFSTRIQWLFEAILLWVLSQFHEAQRTASKAHGELCLKFWCFLLIHYLTCCSTSYTKKFRATIVSEHAFMHSCLSFVLYFNWLMDWCSWCLVYLVYIVTLTVMHQCHMLGWAYEIVVLVLSFFYVFWIIKCWLVPTVLLIGAYGTFYVLVCHFCN